MSEKFRDVSQDERDKLADRGDANPDGSYPIKNVGDLKNAISAIGRSKNPGQTKALIKRRAKELGVPDLVPQEWGQKFYSAEELDYMKHLHGAKHGVDVAHAKVEWSGMSFSFAGTLAVAGNPERVTVDGVEYVVGRPIHIFPEGEGTAVDGREVEFTAQDARVLIDDIKTRDSDLAITFDHETDKSRGSEAGGWMPRDAFVFRSDGLWNTRPLWCVDVYETLIKTGKFRYLSGDALGIGTANPGDPFHPRRLLAASLVPKPGIVRGLQGITLSALKEVTNMAMKCSAGKDCTDKTCEEHFASDTTANASARIPSDRDLDSAFPDTAGGEAPKGRTAVVPGTHPKQDADGPTPSEADAAGSTMVKDRTDSAKYAAASADADGDFDGGNNDGVNDGDSDDTNKEATMGANAGTLTGSSVPAADLDKDGKAGLAAKGLGADEKDAEKFGAKIAAIASKTAISEAEKLVKHEFAARENATKTEAALLEAEKDGRIAPADREHFRGLFSALGYEKASETLGKLPKGRTPSTPLAEGNSFIFGADDDGGAPLDLNAMGQTESGRAKRNELLSQAARWAAEKRIDFLTAIDAVQRGDNRKFESDRVRAASGTQKFSSYFRNNLRSMEIDEDMVKHVQKAMREGKIPDNVMPGVQRFAAISNFQPGARTTLPMGLGFYQAPFIGTEILPEFVGGPDERAAWPAYGLEKFEASVKPAGIGASPGESDLVVSWTNVTLDVYPRTINIDRRSRDASVTLPEGLDTTAAENVRTQVQTAKEVAIKNFMTTNGNYKDSTFYTTLSGGTQWSSTGTPLTDVPNAMAHIRKAIRQWPDLMALSADAFIAVRRNSQVLTAVQYTGTLARPGQMVPIETIIALFGMSVVVGESGYATLPDGSDVADIWGQDAFIVATGKGRVVGPRFGATVVAGGYPKVRMWPREDRGANGSDAITYSEAWNAISVAKGAAYRWINASASF